MYPIFAVRREAVAWYIRVDEPTTTWKRMTIGSGGWCRQSLFEVCKYIGMRGWGRGDDWIQGGFRSMPATIGRWTLIWDRI